MIKKAMAANLLALLLLALTACGNKNGNGIEKMPEQENSVMNIDINKFSWTREPQSCVIKGDTIEVVTKPKTDLWQRTYYHFQNDNAPVFQMETEEKYFSFIVKTDFTGSHHRFDQCGIALYLEPRLPLMQRLKPCGIGFRAAKTTIASSVPPTGSISPKCAYATCIRAVARYASASMPARPRSLRLRRFSPI